jgi:LmbE family N-acetylglucosaminyl deacetylase
VAWRNFEQGEAAKPLRRSDFSPYASCESAVYAAGPETNLSAQTLIETLREHIAASPPGALLATTHWLDGHGDHAALGSFVKRLSDAHPVAYAVIHAHTPKSTAHPDCWYPTPSAPQCPCLDERAALGDPELVGRLASHRFRPASPAALPDDAEYGEEKQLCLADRLYRGDEAIKLRAVRSYASQLGRLARNGAHPPALDGIMDCNGYLMSFVRSTEAFVVVAPPAQNAGTR